MTVHIPGRHLAKAASLPEPASTEAMARRRVTESYLARRIAGRKLGRRALRPYERNIMFHYVLEAPDLAQALQRMRQFYSMLRERLPGGHFGLRDEGARIVVDVDFTWRNAADSETALLAIEPVTGLFYFWNWLIDERIEVERICVPFAFRQDCRDRLAELTGQIEFDQARFSIEIDKSYASMRNVRQLKDLADFDAMLPVYRSVGYVRTANELTYVRQIVDWICRNERRIPPFGEVAAMLGQSGSTLKKRLRKYGCSYRQVVCQYRFDQAARSLENSAESIKEIAFSLGYADHNAFRRAFKQWAGMQPARWRDTRAI